MFWVFAAPAVVGKVRLVPKLIVVTPEIKFPLLNYKILAGVT